MKVLQVSFDASLLTLIIDDSDSLIDILCKRDDSFEERDGKIFYIYSLEFEEECTIIDVTNERGIIQYESH